LKTPLLPLLELPPLDEDELLLVVPELELDEPVPTVVVVPLEPLLELPA
jgi:hypothetical protein